MQTQIETLENDKTNLTSQIDNLKTKNDPSSTPTTTTTSSSSTPTVSSSSNNQYSEHHIETHEDTVWVGDTGTKYHHQSCRTLKGNKYEIPLNQALAEGREACKVCH